MLHDFATGGQTPLSCSHEPLLWTTRGLGGGIQKVGPWLGQRQECLKPGVCPLAPSRNTEQEQGGSELENETWVFYLATPQLAGREG